MRTGNALKKFFLSVGRWVRYGYLRIVRIKASPHTVARGVAVGVFVGCLPVIPFQTVIALALAVVFRCNKLAAALGTWVSNPLNVPFFYYGLYRVGRFFVPECNLHLDFKHLALSEMLLQGRELVALMTVGGVVVGLPSSVITYFLTLRVVRLYHARRAARRLKKI